LESVQLLAPIPKPEKYLALGGNYRSHRAESAAAAQAAKSGQIWFNKQVGCITGPFDDVWKPAGSQKVDYEGELGVVIGRRCRDTGIDAALDHVAAYCVCNDVSIRDWQAQAPTATLGKSFDTHGPIGPWLTTSDGFGGHPDLMLRTWVNGGLRQQARTSDMVADIAEMIVELSMKCTLEPGDVLATGTPAGIGKAMNPPTFLQVGDVVKIEIERLGTIENRIVAAPRRNERA
jgi:2-keto-4-pentenoate hydratase/2-oxohepta-3-ene-1,7-dioic acid hydratase in catechol pathway